VSEITPAQITHDGPDVSELGSVITNPRLRVGIYTGFVVLLVIAYGMNAAFGALHLAFPDWLIAGNAVLNALGLPVGGLAIANVNRNTNAA
jgi:hypothetical protein